MPRHGRIGRVRDDQPVRLFDSGHPAGTAMEDVWRDIEGGLRVLAASNREIPENENGLTQELIRVLERRPGSRAYYFQPETMVDVHHGNSPRIDLSVSARDNEKGVEFLVLAGAAYGDDNCFLYVEAKRLPARPGREHEREYVSGKRGGLERFKRGVHGRTFREVGMVAYIQKHTFDHWHQTLNGWIAALFPVSCPDLPWDAGDQLSAPVVADGIATLHSHNLRTADQQRLSVRHLWVLLAARP